MELEKPLVAATCIFQKRLLQGLQCDVQVTGVCPSLPTLHAQQFPLCPGVLGSQVIALIYSRGNSRCGQGTRTSSQLSKDSQSPLLGDGRSKEPGPSPRPLRRGGQIAP